MNISYNWLKSYIDFDLTPQQTADALTSIGLETGSVDEVESIKGGLKGLIIGKVLTCIEHPNSDHLHITTVDFGDAQPARQIVCGAPNVAAGQTVVVATVGTTLYSGDESFTIKKSKVRGEESLGMICAEDEIGVGTSHDGIIVLPDDVPIGIPAADYYGISSDYVLEVDITPNRVDATSHIGVARDLVAYLNQQGTPTELRRPSVEAFPTLTEEPPVTVTIDNEEACPRYAGVTIEGIEVKPSPKWMQERLSAIGLRPINNIVDITNYILHELGQPLHAFDRTQITTDQVVVRTLPSGTKFTTLDGVEHTLDERDLMICNGDAPMALGGIFGGLNSGVTDQTTSVFIESAYFNPTWIRKAARRHGLNTDASFRYERGCDPSQVIYALRRAALLVTELAGGKIVGYTQDVYPTPIAPARVTLSYDKVNKLIGKEIPQETVKSIIKSLEMELIGETTDTLELTIPSYRVDVTRDVDVIEDILRIYGYNNVEISSSMKSNLLPKNESDKSYALQQIISEQLTGSGFNEILNNSLTATSYYENLESYPAAQLVEIMNPLSNDLNVMRQTLLFGGINAIAYNRNRRATDLYLYEFGNCYQFNAEAQNDEQTLSGYSEDQRLGLWICGNRTSNNWNTAEAASTIFELKAYLLNIFTRVGVKVERLQWTPLENDLYANGILLKTNGGKTLGTFGILRKQLLKQFDIDTEVYYAELSWTLILREIRKHQVTFAELSKFPEVKRDLALLVDTTVTFEAIERIAYQSEKKLLQRVELFDVYEGQKLPGGKKSYGVSFYLQDSKQTLKDKQIDAVMGKIQKNLESQLSAQLR